MVAQMDETVERFDDGRGSRLGIERARSVGYPKIFGIHSPYPVVTRTTGCVGASFSRWTWSAAPLAA